MYCSMKGDKDEKGERGECTDENIVFRCDSDKNSLVIIYMF